MSPEYEKRRESLLRYAHDEKNKEKRRKACLASQARSKLKLHCECCNVGFVSPKQHATHLQTNKHAKKMMVQNEGQKIDT